MKITLLVDLDDTLLNSNMDKFIPAYFQELSKATRDLVEPDLMLKSLMAGTRKMMRKTSSEGSLSDTFDRTFYSSLGVGKEELRKRLDDFYDEIFPSLGYLTSQKPEAVEFMDRSFRENHRVVIATNPVFPIKAVEHRLRWAGLEPEKYNFSLVTSFEDSHFTKENIAYFPEILGRLGWPDDPVIMIGNDLEMDIKPAIQAGIPIYWVEDAINRAIQQDGVPKGSIKDFYPWLDTQEIDSMKVSQMDISSLLYSLSATPAVLDGWMNSNGKEAQFEMSQSNIKRLNKTIKGLLNTEENWFSILIHNFDVELEDQIEWSTIRNRKGIKDLNQDSQLKKFTSIRQLIIDMIRELFDAGIGFSEDAENEVLGILYNILTNDKKNLRKAYNNFL